MVMEFLLNENKNVMFLEYVAFHIIIFSVFLIKLHIFIFKHVFIKALSEKSE